jgi:hypothetical protein
MANNPLGANRSQAFSPDFQLGECNRMTGDAGQTGTLWGFGVLQVCWGA